MSVQTFLTKGQVLVHISNVIGTRRRGPPVQHGMKAEPSDKTGTQGQREAK